jgi:hypothetical protein
MLEIFKGPFPELERVTDCGIDVVPSRTVPKARLLDERATVGVPGLLPDRVMDCGLVGTLSEIAMAPW